MQQQACLVTHFSDGQLQPNHPDVWGSRRGKRIWNQPHVDLPGSLSNRDSHLNLIFQPTNLLPSWPFGLSCQRRQDEAGNAIQLHYHTFTIIPRLFLLHHNHHAWAAQIIVSGVVRSRGLHVVDWQ